MATICHRITVKAPRQEVFEALSTLDGLREWWTTTTEGESIEGGVIDFRFGEHSTKMRVEALDEAERVAWHCVGSAPEWVGTEVQFQLENKEEDTIVQFEHSQWQEAGPFFSHCSTKWATFLLSLKGYLETGAGRTVPERRRHLTDTQAQ